MMRGATGVALARAAPVWPLYRRPTMLLCFFSLCCAVQSRDYDRKDPRVLSRLPPLPQLKYYVLPDAADCEVNWEAARKDYFHYSRRRSDLDLLLKKRGGLKEDLPDWLWEQLERQRDQYKELVAESYKLQRFWKAALVYQMEIEASKLKDHCVATMVELVGRDVMESGKFPLPLSRRKHLTHPSRK